MTYPLSELLMRLGANGDITPEAPSRWHYSKADEKGVGGFAEIRIDDETGDVIAEMRHWRADEALESDPDPDARKVETFFLQAVRVPDTGDMPRYELAALVIDGEDYPLDSEPLNDLSLSIFHSRVIELNSAMIEEKVRTAALNALDVCDVLGGNLAPPEDRQLRVRSMRERMGEVMRPKFALTTAADLAGDGIGDGIGDDMGDHDNVVGIADNVVPFRPRGSKPGMGL